ncbi:MAG: YkvA family protein [Ornithinibacter sp.]
MAATARRFASFGALFRAIRLAVRPGGPSLGERASALPRLFGATLRGEYSGTSMGRLVLAVAAIGYVVSPVDFVPEAFLGVFGLLDDAFVLSWVAARLVTETEDFIAWEQARGAQAGPRPATAGSSYQTVPGDVIR